MRTHRDRSGTMRMATDWHGPRNAKNRSVNAPPLLGLGDDGERCRRGRRTCRGLNQQCRADDLLLCAHDARRAVRPASDGTFEVWAPDESWMASHVADSGYRVVAAASAHSQSPVNVLHTDPTQLEQLTEHG